MKFIIKSKKNIEYTKNQILENIEFIRKNEKEKMYLPLRLIIKEEPKLYKKAIKECLKKNI